jgi:hypothetical protein
MRGRFMSFDFEVHAESAFALLEGVGEKVIDRFAEELRPIEQAMLDDARARAAAHFHSVGAKPGLYLGGFGGGVTVKHGSAIGWMGNSNPLAHLFEAGFTISDLMIYAKNAEVMKFAAGAVGDLYRKAVHRHATAVQPYPAILPAFEAKKGDIEAAAEQAAKGV